MKALQFYSGSQNNCAGLFQTNKTFFRRSLGSDGLLSLCPAGLLQFSTGLPPQPEDAMTLPASSIPHVTVQEEDGEVRLLVIRAQGLLGRVLAEFRTVSLTAFSPEDYQVNRLILWKPYLSNRLGSSLGGLEGTCTGPPIHSTRKISTDALLSSLLNFYKFKYFSPLMPVHLSSSHTDNFSCVLYLS